MFEKLFNCIAIILAAATIIIVTFPVAIVVGLLTTGFNFISGDVQEVNNDT